MKPPVKNKNYDEDGNEIVEEEDEDKEPIQPLAIDEFVKRP